MRAQPRDTVRVGVVAPRGLGPPDPHLATAHVDRMAASWCHAGLLRFPPGTADAGRLEPDLAARWEASPDRTDWVFHLRPGVAFQDGFGTVAAADVAFSLRKAADPARSAFAGDYAGIARVETPDPLTVRIVTAGPAPDLPGLVANYAGGFVLSRDAAGVGRFVGAGPFRPTGQRAEQSAGQWARYAAHDGYFRGAPALRGIEYRFLSSPATGELAFRAGELDVMEGLPDQGVVARMRDDGAVVDVIGPAEISWLHLNVTQRPLDDARVRRAVALAVNRAELRRWRGPDVAEAARGVVPAAYLGFRPDRTLAEGSAVEAARRLLAEAGYRDGVRLQAIHTANPSMLGAIEVVQAQLRRAGITLELRVVDHLAFHQMIRQDLSPVVHYAAARFPTAGTVLTQFFLGRSTVGRPGGITNFSHCTVADEEIEAAQREPEPERRLELWDAAQRRIADAVCAVPLLETRSVWLRRPTFEYGFAFEGAIATGPLITEASRFVG